MGKENKTGTEGRALGEMIGGYFEKLEEQHAQAQKRIVFREEADMSRSMAIQRLNVWHGDNERKLRLLSLLGIVSSTGVLAACVMAAMALVK